MYLKYVKPFEKSMTTEEKLDSLLKGIDELSGVQNELSEQIAQLKKKQE